MTDTRRQYLFLLPCFALMVAFLLLAGDVKAGVIEGMELCFYAVIPSVFPFTIFSSYLSSLSTSGTGTRTAFWLTFLTGLVCGFPLGAKAVIDGYRHGIYTKEKSERLLAFCNNTSISFLVAGVGGAMRGSLRDGMVLFFIQALVAALVACLTWKKSSPAASTCNPRISSPFSLSRAISEGVLSTLTVCGFVIYFSALISLSEALLPEGVSFSLTLLLEVSRACGALVGHPLGIPLSAFAVCFSGISVHLQVATLLNGTDLSMKPYLIWKGVAGMLGFFFGYLYLLFS